MKRRTNKRKDPVRNDDPTRQRPALTFLEETVASHLVCEMFRQERPGHADTERLETLETFLDGMRHTLNEGIGASTTLELPELRISFTLVSDTTSVIRAERLIVHAPFGSEGIESYRHVRDIDVTDNGSGTYEFRIVRASEADIITELRDGLAGMRPVTLSDAEARRLGLLPPLVH